MKIHKNKNERVITKPRTKISQDVEIMNAALRDPDNDFLFIFFI